MPWMSESSPEKKKNEDSANKKVVESPQIVQTKNEKTPSKVEEIKF